jgi:hypothetical protein
VKLPTDVSGQELVKALLRVGFVVNRKEGATSSSGAPIRTLASLCLTTNESVWHASADSDRSSLTVERLLELL